MNRTVRIATHWRGPQIVPWRSNLSHLGTPTRISFKNILFATDFSSTTDLALPYAVEIARRSGGTIHAVHVIQPEINPLMPPSGWPQMAQDEQRFREAKTKELEQELQGLPHDFTSPEGGIWECLFHIIEKRGIDLVILGTHGRSGVEKVLAGSVAEEIFRQASCPVLTVSPAVSSKATHAAAAELNHILYATDFSPESLRAARYAIYLAQEHRADLILMHSIQDPEPGQESAALETLRDIVPNGAELPSKPICVVEEGTPADAILRVAKNQNADIIVIGVRNADEHLTAAIHLSKSIAYRIVTHATCPTLTIRT